MENREPSAVAVFDDLEHAERGIHELQRAGFAPQEIGIIGHVNPDQHTVPTPPQVTHSEVHAMHGVVRGGIWGAVVGLIVIAIIPGLGDVSGLGHWFEVVAGGAFGAAVGGAVFAFGSLALTRPESRYLEGELRQGHFFVTVANPKRKDEASSLLRRYEAETTERSPG
jgi:Heat induced stress protein YflT domain